MKKLCTCLAVCRGIDKLGPDWQCVLTACPNPRCVHGIVDSGGQNPDGTRVSEACPWEGHKKAAINPEWEKLSDKPHFVPAICHPDAFKTFYLGPLTAAQLYAVTIGHWKEQRALVEWAITLLCNATPNQKSLSEEQQQEWHKAFTKWFALANLEIF